MNRRAKQIMERQRRALYRRQAVASNRTKPVNEIKLRQIEQRLSGHDFEYAVSKDESRKEDTD